MAGIPSQLRDNLDSVLGAVEDGLYNPTNRINYLLNPYKGNDAVCDAIADHYNSLPLHGNDAGTLNKRAARDQIVTKARGLKLAADSDAHSSSTGKFVKKKGGRSRKSRKHRKSKKSKKSRGLFKSLTN
jgi:hypothetical protein